MARCHPHVPSMVDLARGFILPPGTQPPKPGMAIRLADTWPEAENWWRPKDSLGPRELWWIHRACQAGFFDTDFGPGGMWSSLQFRTKWNPHLVMQVERVYSVDRKSVFGHAEGFDTKAVFTVLCKKFIIDASLYHPETKKCIFQWAAKDFIPCCRSSDVVCRSPARGKKYRRVIQTNMYTPHRKDKVPEHALCGEAGLRLELAYTNPRPPPVEPTMDSCDCETQHDGPSVCLFSRRRKYERQRADFEAKRYARRRTTHYHQVWYVFPRLGIMTTQPLGMTPTERAPAEAQVFLGLPWPVIRTLCAGARQKEGCLLRILPRDIFRLIMTVADVSDRQPLTAEGRAPSLPPTRE